MATELTQADFGASAWTYHDAPDRLLETQVGGGGFAAKTVFPSHPRHTETTLEKAVNSFQYAFDNHIPSILNDNRNDELHFEFVSVDLVSFRGTFIVDDLFVRVRGPQLRTRRNLGAGPVRFSRLG